MVSASLRISGKIRITSLIHIRCSDNKYSQPKMALRKKGLTCSHSFLSKEVQAETRWNRNRCSILDADKNSALAYLSLTDEGSAFIKEIKAGPSGTQPGHSYPPVQSTTEFSQF